MYNLLMVIFILDVVLLIPVILMQSGSGADAGMFGSSLTMGAFGAKTSEVLTNVTRWMVAIFMVSAFLLGYLKVREYKAYTRQNAPSVQQSQAQKEKTQPQKQDTQPASATPELPTGEGAPLNLPAE